MQFDGVKLVPITSLGISQIYLNRAKLEAVKVWLGVDNMHPLPVHDFGNGVYTLTDGHTRAYAAYKSGITHVPVVYDNDEIVAGMLGKRLYAADIEWCTHLGLHRIPDLEGRIISEDEYERLWINRCDRSYELLTRFTEKEIRKYREMCPKLCLYGASEDKNSLYYEDNHGELYVFRDGILEAEINIGGKS